MKLRLHRFGLPLEHDFTIARATTTVQRTLVVELEHNGSSGFGESSENAFYGFSLESMSQSIERCTSHVEAYEFGSPEELWIQLSPILKNDPFALCAIDLAAHDLFGKLAGRRTYDVLGLQWDGVPESSYTIGIDSIETMIAKLRERPDWGIYKIKLGTDQDVEIIRRLREQTSATFRVDANCGWSVDEAIANSIALQPLGVEFIEQPLAADTPRGQLERIFHESAIPVIADESCLVEADVAACAGLFHGVNVKLCKCGGLTPALRMLREARTLGLKTMVGCMIESSAVGISAAAQLLPLLDYADLDGAVLIAEDPADGISIDNGRVSLSGGFGNGVQLVPDRAARLTV